MTTSEERLWRTLIHVTDRTETSFSFVLPGWDPNVTLTLPLEAVPFWLPPLLVPGKRLHARVNIEAENQADLQFHSWEPN